MPQNKPPPTRFIGLDVHQHYLIAIGVDVELDQVLGPQRACSPAWAWPLANGASARLRCRRRNGSRPISDRHPSGHLRLPNTGRDRYQAARPLTTA